MLFLTTSFVNSKLQVEQQVAISKGYTAQGCYFAKLTANRHSDFSATAVFRRSDFFPQQRFFRHGGFPQKRFFFRNNDFFSAMADYSRGGFPPQGEIKPPRDGNFPSAMLRFAR